MPRNEFPAMVTPRKKFFDMDWNQFVAVLKWGGIGLACVIAASAIAMGIIGVVGYARTFSISSGTTTNVNSGGTGVSLVSGAGSSVIIRSLVMDSAGSISNVGDTTHINVPYASSRGTGIQLAVNGSNSIRSITCNGICSPSSDGNTVTFAVPNPTVTSAGSANSLVFNSATRQIVSLLFGPGMSSTYINGGQTLLMDSTPYNATISVKNQGAGVPLMIVESIAPTIRSLVGEGSVSIFNVGDETHISGADTSVTSTSGGTSLVFNSAARQLVSLMFGPNIAASFVNGGQNLLLDVNLNASLTVTNAATPSGNQAALVNSGNAIKLLQGSNTIIVTQNANTVTITGSVYGFYIPPILSVAGQVSSAMIGSNSWTDLSNFFNNFERGLLVYDFFVTFTGTPGSAFIQIATPLPGPAKSKFSGTGYAYCFDISSPGPPIIYFTYYLAGGANLVYDGVNYYVGISFITPDTSAMVHSCHAEINYLTTN